LLAAVEGYFNGVLVVRVSDLLLRRQVGKSGGAPSQQRQEQQS
jgi:hypothetical protein